ncbi:MAG TPA: potassium-transporting ATPase subunit KdpA [Acidimicrobiia bacterium]|jgi:K+-transporting ATPase ATPase A chain
MQASDWLQWIALIVAIAISIPLLGGYMAKVFGGGAAPGDRVFGPAERLVYRICRIDAEREQRWTVYAYSVIAFSAVGAVVLYGIQRLQTVFPLNPTEAPQVGSALSFNTSVSFLTNTNWQSYLPETTVSHFTQMVGLVVQNFVSPAVGLAVMIAFVRGLARRRSNTIGNFWVDLTRGVFRIFLPAALLIAIVFIALGTVQNFHGFEVVRTLEGNRQVIPGGPTASQEAIKILGTNGGGFWNVNSAHPLTSSSGLTNFLEIYLLSVIGFSLTYTYGKLVGNKRQGYVLLAVMVTIWIIVAGLTTLFEVNGNPKLDALHVNQQVTSSQSGGNLEGKEVRFGAPSSALFAGATTGTSTGAVDSMHDSFTPLGGMMPLIHMKLGEVSPGGVGVGMNGMLMLALLAVFIAGLMVGRTPEYLGKKIQATEIKLVVIYILAMPVAVLVGAGIAIVTPTVLNVSLFNPGPHGFTEVLYAFTSAANNNGSAFAGITANTQWMNTALGLVMLVGRFFLIIPTLAIAGALARKDKVPASAGTFPTDTPLFAGLLFGVVVIVAGLTFFPALALGPIVEQLGI